MSRVTEKPRPKEQPLEQPKIWLGIAVALPLAIAGGFLATAKIEQLKQLTKSVSIAPTPVDSVSALGKLEPKGEIVKLSASNSGLSARVKQILVKEGQQVHQGQIIAVLDSRDGNEALLDDADAKLQESRANLQQVLVTSPIDVQAQAAVISRLQAQLSGQRETQSATIARIAAQLSGERVAQQAEVNRVAAELRGQRDSLVAMVSRVRAEQRNALVDDRRYEFLYRQGAISQQERDRRRLNAFTSYEQLREDQAGLRRTIQTLQQQLKETRANQAKTINTLREQLLEAIATRNQTVQTLQKQIIEEHARLSRLLQVRPTDIERARAQVIDATALMKKARADLQFSYVRAPITGEILKIYTKSGEVMSSNGIAEMGQTDHMVVTAEVPEDHIGKVRLGQIVTVTSENGAFSGEITGTVARIGREIGQKDVLNTDPAADIDARVVQVKIALSPESSRRVSGLTNAKVLVEIHTEPYRAGAQGSRGDKGVKDEQFSKSASKLNK
jgi:HlyD family secretion protein